MHPFPHHYVATASASGDDDIGVASDRLPVLASAAPREFDGPGNRWSPETLVTAAVADCFVLTFRGVARASRLSWLSIRCSAEGTLDRVDGVTQFTGFRLHATLTLPAVPDAAEGRASTDADARALRVLHKAHQGCLIANSLKGTTDFSGDVVRAGQSEPGDATASGSGVSAA
jgi:organic hydroperoxide reductase OsmC/OhrA